MRLKKSLRDSTVWFIDGSDIKLSSKTVHSIILDARNLNKPARIVTADGVLFTYLRIRNDILQADIVDRWIYPEIIEVQ